MSRQHEKNTGFVAAFSNLLTMSEKGGIERQERQGQTDLVRDGAGESVRLPILMGRDGRVALEKAGVIFGSDADELFLNAVLPAGWSIKAEKHPLHSSLLDAAGRKRAAIFYKAAFSDQRADLTVLRRYNIRSHVASDVDGNPVRYSSPEHTHYRTAVMDGESVHKVIDLIPVSVEAKDHARDDAVTKEAETYLDGQFPNWRDPSAYWD